jgi:Tol biopolymer transport system component
VRLAPQGDRIAYAKRQAGGTSVHYVPGAGEPPRRLAGPWPGEDYGWGLAFSPDGREIWFSAPERPGGPPALRAVTLSGEERLLARDLGAVVLHDVARDGRALVTLVDRRKRLLARPSGAAAERELSWFYGAEPVGISADGTKVLFVESGEATAGQPWIFLRGTDGAPPARLAEGLALGLSPDGGWILHRPRASERDLFLVPTGAGEPAPLPTGGLDVMDARWFPDGRRILLRARQGAMKEQLWLVDPESSAPQALTDTWTVGEAVISPDGRQVAALGASSTLLLFPVEGDAPREAARLERDDRLVAWTPDGQGIIVRSMQSLRLPARLDRVDLASGRRARWREIAPEDRLGVESMGALLLAADGQGYVYSCERFLSDLYLVEGLR